MTESEPRVSKGPTGDDHQLNLVKLNKMLEEEYIRITREIYGLSQELSSYFDQSHSASAQLEGVLPQKGERSERGTSRTGIFCAGRRNTGREGRYPSCTDVDSAEGTPACPSNIYSPSGGKTSN